MTEKFKGHIVKWHDEKGFGFIKCQDLSEEIFFHISQYKGKQRPEINEQVVFTLGKNRQGKTQALGVISTKNSLRAIPRSNGARQPLNCQPSLFVACQSA